MKKFFKLLLIPMIFLALSILIFFYEAPPPSQEKQKPLAPLPVSVELGRVEIQDAQSFNEFPGTLQSRISVSVMAQITGRILVLNAHSGQHIKQGDLLVQLDAEEIRTRIRQAESSFAGSQSTLTSAKLDLLALSAKISAAQASLVETEQDYERFQQLVKQNVEPRKRLEEAESRWKNAKATLESIQATVKAAESAVKTQESVVTRALAQIDEIKTQLNYTEIRSPIDGIIIDKYLNAGDLATPGRQILALQSAVQLRMEASVSESCARQIRIGNSARIWLEVLQETLETRVSEIVPSIDPTSRSFLVRADLPAREEFQPGMFGRLQFPCGTEKILSIPSQAILERGQLDLVFVASDKKASLRLVRLGRKFKERVEILSGLNAEELVVLNPPPFLKEETPLLFTTNKKEIK